MINSFFQRCCYLSYALSLVMSTHSSAESNSKFENSSSYAFNPLATKRDPFAPPLSAAKGNVNELQRYDLNEITLVGILTGQGSPQAMIVLPDGNSHIVRVGDVVGKRSGRVSKITLNEVIVKESYKDYHDRVSTETTALVLAQ